MCPPLSNTSLLVLENNQKWCTLNTMEMVKIINFMATNNEELKRLMVDLSLTQSEVSGMTESSVEAVKSWCSGIDSKRYRNMPTGKLKLLKYELVIREKG